MIPSAASTISSALAAACGFSIFAISGMSESCSASRWRTGSRSAPRRMNDSAIRSTPICTPASISRRSSSLTAGSDIVTLGRFSPCRDATVPPTSTAASTSPSRESRTRRRMAPSARYTTSSRSTRSAKPGHAIGSRCASPVTRSAVSTTLLPASRVTTSPATGPMRSLGPGMSWSTATSRPTRSAAARTRSTASACCSGAPWAKFRRATSMPTAIIRSSTAGSREAGPIVATILVDRIGGGIHLEGDWSCPVRGGVPGPGMSTSRRGHFRPPTGPSRKARS